MPASLIRILSSAVTSVLLMSGASAEPQTVSFASADGSTEIVAYLYSPKTGGAHPAVVLLHGRGGLYSSNDNAGCTEVSPDTASPCNAATLSKRHRMWGEYWSERGYLALLPDSFGPRSKARGFGRFTHDAPDRADVNERTVRPLDAEGALAYLRGRRDVIGDQVFLQGWSNGASTALNVMIRQGARADGYRGALVFYPGCGPKSLLSQVVSTTAPIAMLLGTDDEEVSPTVCRQVAEQSKQAGTRIDLTVYPGATHDFDYPVSRRQSVPGNRAALSDVLARAIATVERWKN